MTTYDKIIAKNTHASHYSVHDGINTTTRLPLYMTEELSTPSFCEVCGVDVSPNTDLKKFGKVFCSQEQKKQYRRMIS